MEVASEFVSEVASQGAASVNALTVDVEDYFQVSAFESVISRPSWETRSCRVERNVERILELFDQHKAYGTFFTLGWIAERFPQVVRRIVAAGHEVASHGRQHIRVNEQDPAAFAEDISSTKALLEDIAGQPVRGYRAASFSIGASNLWALDVIAQAGYRYSSSIYPVRHDLYGMPEAPRFSFRWRETGLMEIPITTVKLFGRNIPGGGGGYFRLFPYRLSQWALRRVNQYDRQSAVFYFHPWEIDPTQPRIDGIGHKTRFRHYLNLGRMQTRLQRLLADFQWDRMDKVFDLQ